MRTPNRAAHIKYLIMLAGKNQTLLAARLGVSRQTISRWVGHPEEMKLADLDRMAENLGVKTTELIGGANGN